jgi:hypothetical protein
VVQEESGIKITSEIELKFEAGLAYLQQSMLLTRLFILVEPPLALPGFQYDMGRGDIQSFADCIAKRLNIGFQRAVLAGEELGVYPALIPVDGQGKFRDIPVIQSITADIPALRPFAPVTAVFV